MARENINDILAFLAVAQERSFTRAAAKLGVSQSALSHTMRALETRLGVRLLTRTTRSVSPTEAGERLMQTVAPRLEEVEPEIAAVAELGEKVSGTIRITAIDHVVDSVLWPRLATVLEKYPELRVEVNSEYRMICAWELRDGDRSVEARVNGQVTFNGAYQMLHAALSGY